MNTSVGTAMFFRDSASTIWKIRSGLRTNRQRFGIIMPLIAILALDVVLETLAVPILYKGIPLPYGGGTKPIGGALFVATFFHLILIGSSVIVIVLIAKRSGMSTGELLPKSRGGWIDLSFLIVLFVSGLASWFNPLAIVLFIISGTYLVATELE
jgi:hypothetical protein